MTLEGLESRLLFSAGDLDVGFGVGGLKTYVGASPVSLMAVQGDGKIVLAGVGSFVERLNADGSRDLSFGENGEVSVAFNVVGMAITPNGKIVLGGGTASDVPGVASQWNAARLNADGSPDPTFNGVDPDTQTPLAALYVPPTALVGVRLDPEYFALQPDGKVIVGGLFHGGENDPAIFDPFAQRDTNVELIRFNADGTIDTSFGQQGETLTRNGDWITPGTEHPLLILSNGQIVVGGFVHPAIEGLDPYEVRFDSGGRFVSSRYTSIGYTTSIAAAITSSGGAVFASYSLLSGTRLLDIDGRQVPFDFNTSVVPGSLDRFGAQAGFGQDQVVLATSDNKLLLASGGGMRIALARVNADGSPDVTFGVGGTTTPMLDPYHDGWDGTQSATAMAMTPEGDILVAGDFRGNRFIAKFQGGSHAVGEDLPRVSVGAFYSSYSPANSPLFLGVHFYGESAIDVSTIDEGDILVTGPNGYSALGKFSAGYDAGPNRVPLDAAYTFSGPDGGALADGVYTVRLVGEVLDVLGHAVPTGIIGTFTAPVVLPVNRAPDDASFVADLLTPYGPRAARHFMTFSVRMHSAAGVDLSSLGDGNFSVTRLGGDGLTSADAQFVSATTSADGTTCVATYRVGAPGGGDWSGLTGDGYGASGGYAIAVNRTPLDNAGHTLPDYLPGVVPAPLGKFTNLMPANQPVAILEGIDAPVAGGPVTFRVRYMPGPYATIDLSSIQDKAVWVDPADAPRYFDADWAHLDRADVVSDGSVVATYSVVGSGGSGLFGIHVGSTSGYLGTDKGPRDSNDTAVPNGLLGAFDMDYARRRPSATLLTSVAPSSPRRYVTFRVRYSSFAGIRTEMLGDADLIVTGPDGVRLRVRFEKATDDGDATETEATYLVRLPPGAPGGDYQVFMAARQVRELNGRRVSAGVLGSLRVPTPWTSMMASPAAMLVGTVFPTVRKIADVLG